MNIPQDTLHGNTGRTPKGETDRILTNTPKLNPGEPQCLVSSNPP